MIRFENVSIAYDRKSKPALDDVSLDIQRGEFVFLVGSSGSGKSTLLRLVLREHRTPHGQIYVAGQNVANVPSWRVPKFRRGIGVVFQDFRLIQTKTVFANVAYAMQVLGKSRAAIRAEVPRVLELVGLEDKGRRLPTELSGGEQQRVAIARAIVNQPGILLADEPTGNLDPTTSAGIMEVLDKINQNGTTVVMATHDDDIVNSMRKRVIELKHGKVVRDENAAQYTSMIPIVPAAGLGSDPAMKHDAEPQTRRQRIVSAAAVRDAADDSLPPRLERRRGPDAAEGNAAEGPADGNTAGEKTAGAKNTNEDQK
ncbi:cell division ATP-binding protein [Arthrobacter sp. PAMC 25486]|uniref:cell division ATP-binding protein FtsE n=1 Tax=Arthrobacter sp. PAMC 25486 TaxID=1494608 RepID=UPI00053635DD|nr:cell division ATP-binding protein FtsE [Arthrobacter sp. PAMC 25486]AIY01233.1 cell division ATP-binding protein [Arthrobacter sp. PAMC 25486]